MPTRSESLLARELPPWCVVIFYAFGDETGAFAILALSAAAILAGTLVQGTSVGTAQWMVLRRPLPRLRWRTWAAATGAGAFIA